ncbi:MAG TPA: hypothetical protein VFN35_31105 [Ktedonobacteraceae bacterium]|nr:hypothetical protein [Ktedonobacteraceae bacterium]
MPPPSEDTQYSPLHQAPTRPEPLTPRPMQPHNTQNLINRLAALWRKEPAYKILSLAIVLVVIASIVFIAMGASALVNGNNGTAWNPKDVQHPPTPVVGTVDAKPTFPTPGSNKGSNSTSQPPAHPSPVLNPTPGKGDPNNPNGDLSVQIVNIPNVVNNNSRVRVDVQTNQPGVTVYLQINYDAAPFFSTTGARATNGNGEVTINWSVRVISLRDMATATVMAVATGPNGEHANSQTVMVTIQR